MNEYVKNKKIKNCGFDDEVEKIIKNLSKLKKNNVLILGDAGVGKTALVEKLCELINEKQVPDNLKKMKIIEMTLGGAVAGTKYRGEFEERITETLKFISKRKDIILFIDEIHNIIRAGAAAGAIGAGDIFKPFMARGDIKVIGATTTEEYYKTINKEKALKRRFTILKLKEPKVKKTIEILKECKQDYESWYDVSIDEKEIVKIVRKSKNKKGKFPDKAFDELESYCYEKRKERKYGK